MRLIGGNISDTPVKEIADGSAFNVGGGGSSEPPSLIDFGTPTTVATFSNIGGCTTNIGWSAGAAIGGKNMDICVWSPLSTSVFYVDSTDSHKLKHVRLSFNADGTLASESAEQDLNSLMAIGVNTDMIVIDKVSSSRCTLTWCKEASTRSFVVACFDLSGDTISLHGALQTRTTTWNNAFAFRCAATCLLDADHLALFAQRQPANGATRTATNRSLPEMSIIKFTTTQSVGAWTVGTGEIDYLSNGQGTGGCANSDADSGKVFYNDGYKVYTEWTWSGTTATFGQTLLTAPAFGWPAGQNNGGMHATKYRHDIEAGRCLSAGSQPIVSGPGATHYLMDGRVTKGQRHVTIAPYSALEYAANNYNLYYTSYFGHMKGESNTIDYDENTFWERQFMPGTSYESMEDIRIFPTAINWKTGQTVPIVPADKITFSLGSGFAGYCGPLCWLTGDAETTIFIIKPGIISGTNLTQYVSIPFTK